MIFRVSTIQGGADFGTIHSMSSAKAWVSSSLKSWPTASGAREISQHIWTHQPCFPLRMSSAPFCQHGHPRKKNVPKRGASEVWAFAKLHFRDEALLKAAG